MAKTKTTFFCKNCGNESPKWIGKCPGCSEWNTYVEETLVTGKKSNTLKSNISLPGTAKPIAVQDISNTKIDRMDLGYVELNRVLGGGLVPGSLVLIGGEPGIGKSTLMLQAALQLESAKVLYVSGEESQQQLKMRADRIGYRNQNCLILTETDTQEIVRHFKAIQPDIVVIDSIQTLQSPTIEATAGSISQIRETAAEMNKLAKS
ncbi:MAG: AAA family ATPase, partial [Bacteroidales bacterium]|nr:AAA family ATPase [Bacteroidales bacterium]